jgi:hypothetical protein
MQLRIHASSPVCLFVAPAELKLETLTRDRAVGVRPIGGCCVRATMAGEIVMSAPTDRQDPDRRDPNSASFYAPRGPRAVRLGQVAEAAAALIPDEPDGATSRRPWANMPTVMDDPSVPRLRRRSLDPDVPPAPPLMPNGRSLSGSIARLLLVVVAAAVIALFAVGQFSFPVSDEQAMELASNASRPGTTVAAKRSEPAIPQLVVQSLRGKQGEPSPLGASVQGQAAGALVMISGLPAGMTLSTGGAVGADAWQLAARDIGNAWIIPPKDFSGTVDLVAELRLADETVAQRRTIRLEWGAPAQAATPAAAAPAAPQPAASSQPAAAPTPAAQQLASAGGAVAPVAAAQPAAAQPAAAQSAAAQPAAGQPAAAQSAAAQPAAAQPAAPRPRQLNREEIEVLVARAKTFLAAGDIAAARVLLQRAVESNNAEAALVLGATYDPFVLRELNVFGVAADLVTARNWYEKAKELGSPDAPRRLEILASAAR